MAKKLKEYRFSLATQDARAGRVGSVDTGKVPKGKSRGGYTGGLGKMQTAASSFPYVELEIDDDDDIDPIDADLVDKLQSRIGAMRFKNDPGAKSKDIPMSRRVTESIPHAHGKIPSTVLYPKKNRGPALGGTSMSGGAYRTGPGNIRVRDPGSLEGNSKPPSVDFDDGERVYHLSDIIEPERRVVLRVRKMVQDILSSDDKE